MDHSSWDLEAYGWCTGEITQLDISLRQSGIFWAESWLCVQTSMSGFRWSFSKINKFKAIVTFHDSEILQSHSVMFLPSTETKSLGERPPHCMNQGFWSFTTEFLALPENFFLRLFAQLSSFILGALPQPANCKRSCFAFPSSTCLRNWILCREQWIAYILSFSSVCQVMQSLLSGFLVRNPHRVVFLRSA